MLKGHVFSEQYFKSEIFALFIDTFLNGMCGVSNNYKNGMEISTNGSTVTVQSGVVCIRGRFVEEDTSTSIDAGTSNNYCKLVIEIDLDKENTSSSNFLQASYKVVTATSNYPNLTQTNIVKNNAGVYQYELARFRTTSSGITDFKDMRTFLDFDSLYNLIKQKLAAIEDESIFGNYLSKEKYGAVLLGEGTNTSNSIQLNNTIEAYKKIEVYNTANSLIGTYYNSNAGTTARIGLSSNDYDGNNQILHMGILTINGTTATASGIRQNSWSRNAGSNSINVSPQKMYVGKILGYKEF